MNQKTNPKKVIIKLSKRKDAARVTNNKKKLKSMKPQNIGLPSGCKIYINESLCKYYKYLWWKCKLLQTRGSIQSFWVTNGSIRIRHQKDEVTYVTHIETAFLGRRSLWQQRWWRFCKLNEFYFMLCLKYLHVLSIL